MNRITYEERRDTYREAIKVYGEAHQLNKFDEEVGEFLAELGRMRNDEGDPEAFADELADVTIMLEQVRLIFGMNEEVCRHMDMKVRRLRRNLGMDEVAGDG